MSIRLLTTPEDFGIYASWVAANPHGSLWQSLAWKHLQEALGREVKIYATMEADQIVASALVVIDRTTFGLSTWDIPRGPLTIAHDGLRIAEELVEVIQEDAQKDGCIALYFSPLASLSFPKSEIRNSQRYIYPEATRVIDLTQSEDQILEQMKPKGRYNIRLAEKHGVRIVRSDEADLYAALSKETGRRDGFTPQSTKTYRAFLETVPESFLLLAFPGGDIAEPPIAGLLGLIWGSQGIYYYGASGSQKRELMAPYLLQWEAMKLCKNSGCKTYDLFGIAPEGMVNHPWSGVSDFKAKFGGRVETYPPEQMYVLRPMTKMLLDMKRKILR